MNEIEIHDRSGVRMIKPYADDTPMLPARSAQQTMQQIIASPAPVPWRRIETVERERLIGDNSHSTPQERAIAALIRSLPISLVMVFVGLAMALIIGLAAEVVIATVLGVLGTLIYYNAQEYKHSQAGVERLRSKQDHHVDLEHERNRHDETIEAIRGDIEIKLEVLKIANGSRRIVDRGQG